MVSKSETEELKHLCRECEQEWERDWGVAAESESENERETEESPHRLKEWELEREWEIRVRVVQSGRKKKGRQIQ